MAEPFASPPGLPPRTLVYLLIGAGALTLFLLLGVFPMQKNLDELDFSIRQATFQIEEQHALQPIYQKMLAIARAGGAKAPPTPVKKGLGEGQLTRVTDTLTALIVSGGLEAVALTPDPSSLGKGSKALAVAIHVKGDMQHFREFLTQLAALPFFENIESVQVQPGSGARDFQVKAWLASE